ncbi:MAG: ornithine carbamoyltransferase [Opitutales bacterium]
MKHFLKENDFSNDEILEVFDRASHLKQNRKQGLANDLAGQTWGLLFYKNSTRTRVSFEVGINELGGKALVLDQKTTQIGRGESIHDTAQVLSRYLHGLVIRTFEHEIIEEFAAHANIPVVNGLTDLLHPCQIYADCFSIAEKLGDSRDPFASLAGKKLAFLGDTSCNMANSWIMAGKLFGMKVSLAGPQNFAPKPDLHDLLNNEGMDCDFQFTSDPNEAVTDADIVYTDVWVSMGSEEEEESRIESMNPFAVTSELLSQAKSEALFMHCMPTHPGMEVSQEVLDSPQTIIFDQAENRLHVQKAILAKLASDSTT